MKRIILWTGFLVLMSGLTLNTPASAQVGNYGLIYQGAYNNAMFLNTKSAIERGIRSRSANANNSGGSTGAAVRGDLNFSSSAQVHAKVLQALATMMSRGEQARIQPNLEVLIKGNYLNEFDKLLKRYGFNSHNLADVVCAFTILSWQAATGGDAAGYPSGIATFRNYMSNSFGDNAEIRRFSDAQRQELGETMSYIATLITLANQDPATKNNGQALTQLRRNAREAGLKFTGMDVTRYTLTPNGFIPKTN